MEISLSPQKLKEEQETLSKGIEKTKKVLKKLAEEILSSSMKDLMFNGVGEKFSGHLDNLEKYTTSLERRSMGVADNVDDEDYNTYTLFHNLYLESNKLNEMVLDLIGTIDTVKKLTSDINIKSLENFMQKKTINI